MFFSFITPTGRATPIVLRACGVRPAGGASIPPVRDEILGLHSAVVLHALVTLLGLD